MVTASLNASPPLSELELAALASAAVPHLQVRGIRGSMRSTDSGYWLTFVDSRGENWLAWAPNAPWTEKRDARLRNVTSILDSERESGRIPFAVSTPVSEARGAKGTTVLVLSHCGGKTLTDNDLSSTDLLPKSLGTAMAALHELPESEYARASGQKATVPVTRKILRSVINDHASAIPSRLRARWLDAIDEDSLWKFEPVPLHGSMGSAYVHAAPGGAVVGMTRFDSAAVGDPAQDMMWLMYHASDAFLADFESAYSGGRRSPDLHVLTRAQLLSELETLKWYARAVAAEDRLWRHEGVKALRDMDEEIGDHRLVAARPEVVEITFTVEDEPLMRLQPKQSASAQQPLSGDSSTGRGVDSGALVDGANTEVIDVATDMETGPFNPFASSDPKPPEPHAPRKESLRTDLGTGSVEVP